MCVARAHARVRQRPRSRACARARASLTPQLGCRFAHARGCPVVTRRGSQSDASTVRAGRLYWRAARPALE
eukprot:3476656-Alexandrium_andersonii.AAC.1